MLKALADDIRLGVARQLLDGPRHVGELNASLGIEPSLLSHHLRVLRRAGIVDAKRDGKAVMYRLSTAMESRRRGRVINFGCCRLSSTEPARFLMLRRSALVGLVAWLCAGLVVAGCSAPAGGRDGSSLEGKITLTGSSTIAPLVSEIAKRFEQRHAAVRVDVQTGGSSRGITDATRGTADIGMSSRALTDPEQAELVSYTLARDGVCLLVHASNPVENLTDDQIRAIYSASRETASIPRAACARR